MGSTVTIPLDAPNPSMSGRQRVTGFHVNPRDLPGHTRHGPEGWELGKGSNPIQNQLGIKTKGRNHRTLSIKSKDGPFSRAAERSWLGKPTPSAPKPSRIPKCVHWNAQVQRQIPSKTTPSASSSAGSERASGAGAAQPSPGRATGPLGFGVGANWSKKLFFGGVML